MSPAPRRLFWPFVKLGIALLAVWLFAVPKLFLLRTALIALLGAPPLQLVVIALCALIALLAYAQLTRTMLGNGPRPGLLPSRQFLWAWVRLALLRQSASRRTECSPTGSRSPAPLWLTSPLGSTRAAGLIRPSTRRHPEPNLR